MQPTLNSADIKLLSQYFVTKTDAKTFATKDDLKAFATKEDLKRFATKKDIQSLSRRIDRLEDLIVATIANPFEQRLSRIEKHLALKPL